MQAGAQFVGLPGAAFEAQKWLQHHLKIGCYDKWFRKPSEGLSVRNRWMIFGLAKGSPGANFVLYFTMFRGVRGVGDDAFEYPSFGR